MIDRRWYVLRVMTGDEEWIAASIKRKGLADAIVPVRILRERRKGVPVEVRRILFPGYVFVHWSGSVASYYEITDIPRVISFLKTERGVPIAVPDEQMAPVLILANKGKPIEISQAYRAGGRIRVLCGPLKDLEGYITKIDPRNGRASIQIPLLNYDHKISLGLEMLAPTSTTNTSESAQVDASPRVITGDQK